MSTPSNDSTAVTSTTDSTITDNTSSNTTPADDADEWQTVGQPKKKKNNKNKKNAAGNSNNSNNNNNHKQHNNSRSSAAADDSVQSDEDSDSDMAAQFMRDGNLGLDGRPVYDMPSSSSTPAATPMTASTVPDRPTITTPGTHQLPSGGTVHVNAKPAAKSKPRYVMNEQQFPKCFVCLQRHDFDECKA